MILVLAEAEKNTNNATGLTCSAALRIKTKEVVHSCTTSFVSSKRMFLSILKIKAQATILKKIFKQQATGAPRIAFMLQ